MPIRAIIERNPTPMILMVIGTIAALVLGLYSFSQNDEPSEVPEAAAAANAPAVDVPSVAPASGDLHPAADPTR